MTSRKQRNKIHRRSPWKDRVRTQMASAARRRKTQPVRSERPEERLSGPTKAGPLDAERVADDA